jgi:hypothetical protein
MTMKMKPKFNIKTNNQKIHLTRFSSRTLLFSFRAAAIAVAPSSPISFSCCNTHVRPLIMTMKKKPKFITKEKKPENSSYQVKLLHAAVLFQSCSNRRRSFIPDFIAALRRTRQTSRMMMKMKPKFKIKKTNNQKIHLTRFSSCTLLFSFRAAAIAVAPSLPTLLQACNTHVSPRA